MLAAALASALLLAVAPAHGATRVLLVGNSLTEANALPGGAVVDLTEHAALLQAAAEALAATSEGRVTWLR